MKIPKIPFNIALIDPATDNMLFSLFSVDNVSMFDNETGDFHPRGLFSSVIFGKQGDKKRMSQHSFINLRAPIVHPFYLKQLISFKPLYGEILKGTLYAIWDDKVKDFVKSNPVNGNTGYAFFQEHFDKLTFKKEGSVAAEQMSTFLKDNKHRAYITKYIVIPAGLRDVEFDDNGRPVEDELNELYRKLLSRANTVNMITAKKNDVVLDNARAALTKTSLDIFNHIYDLIEGKRGFFQSRFASRRVFGTTRNVISGQEAGTVDLNDIRSPAQDMTTVGLAQFMSGMQPKVRYNLREKVLKSFMDNIKEQVYLYDTKTLEKVLVTLPEKTRDRWGTNDGLDSFMGGFLEPTARQSAVKVDGHYIALLYRDSKGFKLVDDINDVPDDKKVNVKPLKWGEMFYLASAPLVKETRGFNTRYPVTGLGSMFPSRTYLKTTELSQFLHPYSDDWILDEENVDYVEFPNPSRDTTYHDTMVIHASTLGQLGADYDGDMLSWSPVWSPEAIKEIDDYLDAVTTYVSPSGGLIYPSSTDVIDWVLFSLTTDM